MVVRFKDVDIEKVILAYNLKGPDYWREVPEAWFTDPLILKTYQEMKKIIRPPYSTFPSANVVSDKSEDLDVKLFVHELDRISLKLEPREMGVYIHDLYEMYAARSIYDISKSIPGDLERKNVVDIIKDKIQIMSGIVNPLDAGQRERFHIWENAKERWERYRAIEANPNLANKIPFGISDFDRHTNGGLGEAHILLFFAETGGFKCVTGNTILTDSISGTQQTVEEVVKQRKHMLLRGLDVNTLKSVEVIPSDFAESGMQEVFEVKLQSGRKITGPAHHPLYTQNLRWEMISDLQKEAYMVATPRKIEFPKQCVSIPKYKTSMLGYMLAEGCLKSMNFTNTDINIVDDFYNCLRGFGDTVYHINKGCCYFIGKNKYVDMSRYREVINRIEEYRRANFSTLKDFCNVIHESASSWIKIRKYNRIITRTTLDKMCKFLSVDTKSFDPEGIINPQCSNLLQWFRDISLDFVISNDKTIPDIIFQADELSLTDFIAKLWSGDGHVTERGGLTYSTASEKMAEQLQHLLLRFGILSSKSTVVNNKFTSYVIRITGASAVLFHKKIGPHLVGDKKLKSKLKLEKMLLIERNQNNDIIPCSTLINIIGYSNFVKVFKRRHTHSDRGLSRTLIKNKLESIDVCYHDSLLKLIDSDIYWDKVVSITPKGMQETFDMEIPVHMNYMANDIYVHNTKVKANLGYNMSFLAQQDVMAITLEVPMYDYQSIIDSRHSGLDFNSIITGKLPSHQKEQLRTSFIDIHNKQYPLYLVDIPDKATSADIIRELEIYKAVRGKYPKVVIVDYANEMEPISPWKNTSEKFKNLGVEFRRIARTYGVRIITSMQLNRDGKKIKDQDKIDLEHVSESHYFANVCHLIVHLYQDPNGVEEVENILNWAIKKNRYGRKDVVFQTFANPSINYIGDRTFRMVS
jgi:replicative DNA helicase